MKHGKSDGGGQAADASDGAAVGGDGRALAELLRQWRTERPDLDLRPFRLVGATMQLAQIMESEFRAVARARFGIGSGDLRIVMALRRAGTPYALRPTDLFNSLLVTSGAVTKQVERLVAGGYVRRVLPEGALRRRVIALTPKGVRAADQAMEWISTSLAGIAPRLAALPPGKVAVLIDTLESLLDEVSPRATDPKPEEGSPG